MKMIKNPEWIQSFIPANFPCCQSIHQKSTPLFLSRMMQILKICFKIGDLPDHIKSDPHSHNYSPELCHLYIHLLMGALHLQDVHSESLSSLLYVDCPEIVLDLGIIPGSTYIRSIRFHIWDRYPPDASPYQSLQL